MIERAMDWLTERERSTYGVAVTRIMIGFVVSSQLLLNWPDRSYTWGEGSRWNETVADIKGYPWFFGLFRALDGWTWDVAYLLVVLSGIALMVGVFTRVTTVTTVILWTSVYVANPYVGSGGDAMLRMVLFYLCFTDAGQKWSVDAWMRERRGHRTRLIPPWVSATLHNFAVILMIHQIVMVYVGSALWKVQSDVWRNGTAVYFPLQTEAYSPWNDVFQPIYANSLFIAGATFTAIVVQLLFPLLLIYRPTRMVALVIITGMHLGIGFLMGIMYFSLAMIAVDMMLVSDKTWRFAADVVHRVWVRRFPAKVETG
ncbi:HTTM domain-containing protein [Aeromicrobium sp.]|uniref:HTTM domain-containing protein n=1 Tax=Aeromicrobium sp. TaxID=1871063 RepID=UPI003C43B7D6